MVVGMDVDELKSRMRRDYQNEVVSYPMPAPQPRPQLPPVAARKPRVVKKIRQNNRKLWIIVVIGGMFLIGGVVGVWFLRPHPIPAQAPVSTGPVPAAISHAVNFPVYYPDQKKLPAGYVLDINSFSLPIQNGVAYNVNYDTNKKIVFSVQIKPADTEIQSFNGNYIPLRIDYQTPIGQAEIGAYNNHGDVQTMVSVPTKTNAWIIITAPYNINQDQLKQVLGSLRQ